MFGRALRLTGLSANTFVPYGNLQLYTLRPFPSSVLKIYLVSANEAAVRYYVSLGYDTILHVDQKIIYVFSCNAPGARSIRLYCDGEDTVPAYRCFSVVFFVFPYVFSWLEAAIEPCVLYRPICIPSSKRCNAYYSMNPRTNARHSSISTHDGGDMKSNISSSASSAHVYLFDSKAALGSTVARNLFSAPTPRTAVICCCFVVHTAGICFCFVVHTS